MTALEGKPALDKLIDIYMDGMMTGASSILATFTPATPEAVRDTVANNLIASLRADPLAMSAVVNEITETLTGIDTGPKDMKVAFEDKP